MSASAPSFAGPSESVIRLMTRKAIQYSAINLSQGFPNEPPPRKVIEALAKGALAGTAERASQSTLTSLAATTFDTTFDELNQYSQPMGRPQLRRAVCDNYARLYYWTDLDPDRHVTITLGATEAMASTLRTIGRPGDSIVVMEPFHEIYPSQCQIFYLKPRYVTLRQSDDGDWTLDWTEFEAAVKGARAVIVNNPHNPTGKVFTHQELSQIISIATAHGAYIITDDIYEFMCYGGTSFTPLPQLFPEARDKIFLCNSVGKSCSATGWRVGWCIHPEKYAGAFRGVHDQLVVMAPHPAQYATETYLSDMGDEYFLHVLPHRYVDRLKRLAGVLKEVGFICHEPQGAYYLFAQYGTVEKLKGLSPMDAAMFMITDIGVACVPGDNFYGKDFEEGKKYLRFAACRSMHDIELACERLLKLKI